MEFKWIATAALAVALIPAAASAQAKTAKDSAAQKSTPRDTVTATSTGDVSAPASNVPEAAVKARENPNLYRLASVVEEPRDGGWQADQRADAQDALARFAVR